MKGMKMKQYSKEFKEQAMRLSDDIGLKMPRSNWELTTGHYPDGGRPAKEITVKNQCETHLL